LLDTVDAAVGEAFHANVAAALGGRPLDYLVVLHIEPDHGAHIAEVKLRHPGVRIVASKKALALMGQFFSPALCEGAIEVREGSALDLGGRSLSFVAAPMVHWPEVMVAYEPDAGILFSADAFGAFGALSGNLFADELEYASLLPEYRRYYANIVGKYGGPTQALLKKAARLDIRLLCPLHGPIWRQNIETLVEKYDLWSKYRPEARGALVCYGSMYGHTAAAASALADKLGSRGVRDIRLYDVSKTHPSYLIAEAWMLSHLVFAAPTYNLGLYYAMDALLREMAALTLRGRKVALIGNHSWASAALKEMNGLISSMQDMEILGQIDIRSALGPDREGELDALADAIAASILN
ncbi:MAG: FprA family A-type flavoprotein, partial [Clostridiales bacterium]|nr:FprA family A-type flavoprotein [Clostridiales bacterium]